MTERYLNHLPFSGKLLQPWKLNCLSEKLCGSCCSWLTSEGWTLSLCFTQEVESGGPDTHIGDEAQLNWPSLTHCWSWKNSRQCSLCVFSLTRLLVSTNTIRSSGFVGLQIQVANYQFKVQSSCSVWAYSLFIYIYSWQWPRRAYVVQRQREQVSMYSLYKCYMFPT